MSKYPFMQVEAFTDRALGGNACAVVFDADDVDDSVRQAIAREMNLSETAFVQSARSADVGARYFTPDREIPLAGHPTIATVFALFESGRLSLEGALTRISLELTTAAPGASSCRRCAQSFWPATRRVTSCRCSVSRPTTRCRVLRRRP